MPRTGDKDQYIFFSVVSHPYRDLSSCFSSWAKSTSTHPSFKLPKLCTYFLHVLSRLLFFLKFHSLYLFKFLVTLVECWKGTEIYAGIQTAMFKRKLKIYV